MEDVIFDYRKLKGRIKEVFDTQDRFADAINIGRVSLSQRLNNKLEFSQKEMFATCDALGVPYSMIPDYFFTVAV